MGGSATVAPYGVESQPSMTSGCLAITKCSAGELLVSVPPVNCGCWLSDQPAIPQDDVKRCTSC